jgi:hypothetical protein
LYSDQGSLQRNSGAIVVNVVATPCEALFRPLLSLQGSFEIYFVGALCGLGKNSNLIGKYFGKTPRYSQRCPVASLAVAELTYLQLCKEWSVARKNTQVAASAGDLNLVHLLTHQ